MNSKSKKPTDDELEQTSLQASQSAAEEINTNEVVEDEAREDELSEEAIDDIDDDTEDIDDDNIDEDDDEDDDDDGVTTEDLYRMFMGLLNNCDSDDDDDEDDDDDVDEDDDDDVDEDDDDVDEEDDDGDDEGIRDVDYEGVNFSYLLKKGRRGKPYAVICGPKNPNASEPDFPFFCGPRSDERLPAIDPNFDGEVKVPAEIDGVPVRVIGRCAFASSDAKAFVLPEGIELIESHAFTEISPDSDRPFILPSTLTEIAESAFVEAYISSIEIPGSVSSIGEFAFGNSYLDEVKLNEGITYIGDRAFRKSCLEKINFPESLGLNIGEDVFDRTSLEYARVPAYDGDEESMDFVGGCRVVCENGVCALIGPMGEYEGGKADIGLFFEHYEPELKPGELIEGDYVYTLLEDGTAKVTGTTRSRLGHLVMPETLGGKPITVIGKEALQMFNYIESIVFPPTVREIEDRALSTCEKLRSVTLPEQLVRIGEEAFRSACVRTLELPAGIVELGKGILGSKTVLAKKDGVLKLFCPYREEDEADGWRRYRLRRKSQQAKNPAKKATKPSDTVS